MENTNKNIEAIKSKIGSRGAHLFLLISLMLVIGIWISKSFDNTAIKNIKPKTFELSTHDTLIHIPLNKNVYLLLVELEKQDNIKPEIRITRIITNRVLKKTNPEGVGFSFGRNLIKSLENFNSK